MFGILKPEFQVAQAGLECSYVDEDLLEPLIFKCWGYMSAVPAWLSKFENGSTCPYHNKAQQWKSPCEKCLCVVFRGQTVWAVPRIGTITGGGQEA